MKRLALVLVVMAVLSFLAVSNLFAWEGGVQYEVTQAVSSGGFYFNDPDINNDGEIVWWDNAVISNYRGMVSSYGAICPSISNNGEIVWLQSASGFPGFSGWQIYSNTRGQLTFGEPIEFNRGCPKVNSSGEVVYTATDGSHYQVYSTTRGQITFNATDHDYAAINDNGEIIWTEAKNGNDQVVSSLRGQLTFDPANKFSLDLNNQGEFSYGSSYEGSLPHVFSSRNGVIIEDAEQYQWYSGVNDHGDIVFTSNVDTGQMEIFVAHPLKSPILKVKANNSESAITITDRDRLNVSISVNPADYAGKNMDWWLIIKAPNGYFSMTKSGWRKNVHAFKGAPLVVMADKTVATIPRPLIGQYTFFFCVDTLMDGMLDLGAGRMFCDTTEVSVERYDPRKVITITKNKAVGDQKVVAGQQSKRSSSFIFSATSDLVIQKIYVGVIPGAESNLSELSDLSIRDNSVAIGSVVSAPDLSNIFLTNFKMAKGTSKIIDAYLGVKAGTPAGHSWRTTISAVAGYDAKTHRPFIVSPAPVNGTLIIGQTLTVVGGELTAIPSQNTPASKLVTFGSQGEFVMENDFKAVNEGFTTHKIVFSLNNSKDILQASCAVSGVTIKYRDKNGEEQSITSAPWYDQSQNAAKVVFSGMTFYTPANNLSSPKYYINISDFESGCGVTGVEVILTLEEFQAVGDSGTQVTVRPNISSKPVYVYKSVPAIISLPIQSPALYNGFNTVHQIKIKAIKGDIGWAVIGLNFEKSPEIEIDEIGIIDASTGNQILRQLISLDKYKGAAAGTIYYIPPFELVIPALGEKNYSLTMLLSGVTDKSYLTIWIGQPSSYMPPTIFPSLDDIVGSPIPASFIWSDHSAVVHSEQTEDWNKDFLIKGLPTAKQTKAR